MRSSWVGCIVSLLAGTGGLIAQPPPVSLGTPVALARPVVRGGAYYPSDPEAAGEPPRSTLPTEFPLLSNSWAPPPLLDEDK